MTRVPVKPGLLRWACERAGVDVAALAKRFPRLPAWLREEARPTLRQLEDFARATHTPFGFFFLPEPPVERVPIPDFRTIRGEALRRPTPNLLDTIYICQQRQEWYREYARVSGEKPFPFVGSVKTTDDVVKVAAEMRDALAFGLDEQRQMRTWVDALRRLIEQADNLGILVMVNGVVGSNNRRKLDPGEFRGFVLSDPLAPLVFINGADTKAAQMFTLAHELAHLWLGESALTDVEPRSVPTNAVENWCHRVAAELLAPLAVVRQELRRGEPLRTTAARVSKRFARAVVMSTWEGRSSFTEAFHLLGCKKMSTFREFWQRVGVPI